MTRIAIQDYSLANPLYVGKTLSFFTVDGEGKKTSELATLYAGPNGTNLLENPIRLDSEGKTPTPVYIEDPVIGVVSGLSAGDTETGLIVVTGRNRGPWAAGTAYYATELVQNREGGAQDKNWYLIDKSHVAESFTEDVSEGNLSLFFDYQLAIQEAQAGHAHEIDSVNGLVTALAAKLLSANNLSDLPDKAAARQNLGLKIGQHVLAPDGDGSQLTGIQGGGPSLGLNSIIRTNDTTIDEDITIPAGTNGMSAGPITIAEGRTVTVEGTWTVVGG
ncbi:hypothetical protein [Terasakiella pusilla]|uniref:hypothetical protein n=1 Tax=Terasakiella pusilla TaxID=64973 RepID=UPI003AA97523